MIFSQIHPSYSRVPSSESGTWLPGAEAMSFVNMLASSRHPTYRQPFWLYLQNMPRTCPFLATSAGPSTITSSF